MFSTTIEFEELPLNVMGSHVGFFDGEAEIGRSGAVLSITLNTHDKRQLHLHQRVNSEWDQDFFDKLAASVREQCAAQIIDVMRDMQGAPALYAADMRRAIARGA